MSDPLRKPGRKLKPATPDTIVKISGALGALKSARHDLRNAAAWLHEAGAFKSKAKTVDALVVVMSAINSAEGAERHAQRRVDAVRQPAAPP